MHKKKSMGYRNADVLWGIVLGLLSVLFFFYGDFCTDNSYLQQCFNNIYIR